MSQKRGFKKKKRSKKREKARKRFKKAQKRIKNGMKKREKDAKKRLFFTAEAAENAENFQPQSKGEHRVFSTLVNTVFSAEGIPPSLLLRRIKLK